MSLASLASLVKRLQVRPGAYPRVEYLKSFIILAPGVNVIKLFTAIIYGFFILTRVSDRGKPSQHSLMFAINTVNYE